MATWLSKSKKFTFRVPGVTALFNIDLRLKFHDTEILHGHFCLSHYVVESGPHFQFSKDNRLNKTLVLFWPKETEQ